MNTSLILALFSMTFVVGVAVAQGQSGPTSSNPSSTMLSNWCDYLEGKLAWLKEKIAAMDPGVDPAIYEDKVAQLEEQIEKCERDRDALADEVKKLSEEISEAYNLAFPW